MELLNGQFLMPAPGGDPIHNPDILPTGRNMHALDPSSIPTTAAVEVAKKVVLNSLTGRQLWALMSAKFLTSFFVLDSGKCQDCLQRS